jgi:hypothetical protein
MSFTSRESQARLVASRWVVEGRVGSGLSAGNTRCAAPYRGPGLNTAVRISWGRRPDRPWPVGAADAQPRPTVRTLHVAAELRVADELSAGSARSASVAGRPARIPPRCTGCCACSPGRRRTGSRPREQHGSVVVAWWRPALHRRGRARAVAAGEWLSWACRRPRGGSGRRGWRCRRRRGRGRCGRAAGRRSSRGAGPPTRRAAR